MIETPASRTWEPRAKTIKGGIVGENFAGLDFSRPSGEGECAAGRFDRGEFSFSNFGFLKAA